MLMRQESIQSEILVTLVEYYEIDPASFVTLPKQTMDSSVARGAVAELRNEGIVEEQVRGVVRLTGSRLQHLPQQASDLRLEIGPSRPPTRSAVGRRRLRLDVKAAG